MWRLGIIGLVAVLLAGCSAATPEGIIGRSTNGGSGATSITMSEGTLTIHYNFMPVRATTDSELRKEIGRKWADKIKRLFDTSPSLRTVVVWVTLPYDDVYGKRTWKQYLRWSISRSKYEHIQWDHFTDDDLLRIVDTIKPLQ